MGDARSFALCNLPDGFAIGCFYLSTIEGEFDRVCHGLALFQFGISII